MPATLRQLLDAELAAGNSVIEVGHSFPAPPAGAYFKLERPVSTRSRTSADGLIFYERNSSIYSGEFTDAKRVYFILEPPNPPPPEPDMDAIREALRAKQDGMPQPTCESTSPIHHQPSYVPPPRTRAPVEAPESVVARFRESMVIDYERWHDGIGYKIELLREASPGERAEIEGILLARGINDWRDVEALAALDSPRARTLLQKTLQHGKREYAAAVLRYAPHLADGKERIRTIVTALETCDFYAGLTQALDLAEAFHPQEVVDALFRGILKRSGEHAFHFAALLLFIHGKGTSRLDWNKRPFLLRFNTADSGQREETLRELCLKVGVDPAKYLR